MECDGALMNLASTVLAVTLAALFLLVGGPKVFAVGSARDRAAHAGLSLNAFRWVGGLETAGALGLLAGIGWRPIGAAAGIGLLLLMIGAVVVHVRARDKPAAMLPAVITALLVLAYLMTLSGATR